VAYVVAATWTAQSGKKQILAKRERAFYETIG
jgi:hypothetical protein